MKKVIGIGSALVDILTRIDNDEVLKEINIPKGSMQLVDEKSSAAIGDLQHYQNYPQQGQSGHQGSRTAPHGEQFSLCRHSVH